MAIGNKTHQVYFQIAKWGFDELRSQAGACEREKKAHVTLAFAPPSLETAKTGARGPEADHQLATAPECGKMRGRLGNFQLVAFFDLSSGWNSW